MQKKWIASLAMFAAMAVSQRARASVVQSGNLIVSEIVGGSNAPTSAAAAVTLQEFATSGGAAIQTYILPSTGNGQYLLTQSGSASSEGQMTLNNGILTVAGYGVIAGTASVVNTSSATVVRRVDSFDVLNTDLQSGPTATASTTAYSANNLRAGVAAGSGYYMAGANTGIVYQTAGGTGAGTIVSTTATNTRVINQFGSDLYFSTGSGTQGIYKISGTPTSAGTATASIAINTNSLGGGTSPYDFYISPTGTVAYVADSSKGVSKYVNSGSGFTLAYTVAAFAYGLAVDPDTNTVYLTAATSSSANATMVESFVDLGTSASSLNLLETASTNTFYRGIVLAPEPTSLSAIGITGLALLRRQRRRIA